MWYDEHIRRETTIKFAQIARGLEEYSKDAAQIAFRRSHPTPASGLLSKDVPWGNGHFPFPVRRATKREPSEDWYLRNGEGAPLFSWRVEILPYLEGLPPSWQTSEPWDGPTKRDMLTWYRFFSYDNSKSSGTATEGGDALGAANALAITGPGTAFGDPEELPMSVKDVAPNTIVVVETRASGIPWPAPGDFDIRTMPRTINAPDGKGISSRSVGGFHVIFADGQVWFLSDRVPFETLEKFFTTAEAEKYDREKLLGPFALHRGP